MFLNRKSSHQKFVHALYKVPIWGKIYIFGILPLILCSRGFAVEIVGPYQEAKKYLNSDLVIIGNVLSCTTKVIMKKDSLITSGRDSGWIYHYTTFMDIYKLKVDSVFKGVFTDSIIVIQSKPFPGDNHRSKFVEVNEKGDSVFVGEGSKGYGGGGADRIGKRTIREQLKCIILLQKEGATYISTLCRGYSESTIDFYKELDRKGLDYFKESQPRK